MSRTGTGRALAVAALVTATLAACAQGGADYQPGVGSPGVGTLAGAAGGAAAGRWVAGGRNNLAAILAGAAIGGLAGNVLVDGAAENDRRVQARTDAALEDQRRLDFERQSAIQRADVERELREREEFEQWRRERGGAVAARPTAVTGDVLTAQRYLTALGYYTGPIDGIAGPTTQRAVSRFQGDQGLPQTGTVTAGLVDRMRAVL
jgi:hypothetical protein